MCVGAVLVLGFANLIADGISMGYGDYLSSKAENDYAANQQLIADWEVENDIHSEMMDLVSAYQEQGMEKDDADKVSILPIKLQRIFTLEHDRHYSCYQQDLARGKTTWILITMIFEPPNMKVVSICLRVVLCSLTPCNVKMRNIRMRKD